MKIRRRTSFVLCHLFPCPLLYVGSAVCYLSMFSSKLATLGTKYHLPLHFPGLCPHTAHLRHVLEDAFQSLPLDFSGVCEHCLVLESFPASSLRFSPASLWPSVSFKLALFCLFLFWLVFLKAFSGLCLLPHMLPGRPSFLGLQVPLSLWWIPWSCFQLRTLL